MSITQGYRPCFLTPTATSSSGRFRSNGPSPSSRAAIKVYEVESGALTWA